MSNDSLKEDVNGSATYFYQGLSSHDDNCGVPVEIYGQDYTAVDG